MKLTELSPVERLLAEFEVRRSKNPRYSLRAFAKQLGLSPGRLSEFLAGKNSLSKANAMKIADALTFTPKQNERWLNSLGFPKQSESKYLRHRKVDSFVTIDEDRFHLIADWEHYAILTFLETDVIDKSEKTLCERLGIKELTARLALNRLLRMGFISQDGLQFRKETPQVSTSSDVPSPALRKSHKQTIEQALDALDTVDVEFRDITSITIPTSTKKLPLAKKMIKDFRRRLAAVMEDCDKDEVYNLNIQLVPVTKTIKNRAPQLSKMAATTGPH